VSSVRHGNGSSETGTLKRSKVNSKYVEDRHKIRCSKCHKVENVHT
jgi:hypothetical protein